MFKDCLVPKIENWRVVECCKEECSVDRTDLKYGFKHGFPPGMRLTKNYKAKVKEWQSLAYLGPYEEKRAVGIVHEFLSLTVEKMVEVEKISHFRKWFGIDLNVRDLFLDHPGIFYLSTKGKRHTVFLREAYERGCLIEPNPIYEARRKLLDLVLMGRRVDFGDGDEMEKIDNDLRIYPKYIYAIESAINTYFNYVRQFLGRAENPSTPKIAMFR
ncbi:hypothetical protein ACJIZ3_002455 [Penstemon smallii]|uniref:PORR domain-containing protein n=1 Tax=Penstemon smallii TaxID=265156 RepID=A0ABD3U7L7_9LAMI